MARQKKPVHRVQMTEGRNQDTLERAILGLSLCIVIEFLIDDIGLGMCLGGMMGVSIGPAIDVLRKNKKSEEQEDNDEKE